LFKPATGFEDQGHTNATPDQSFTSDNDAGHLASCLALLHQKSPDLALLVERWDALPEALRAGIVAMVTASLSEGRR